MTAPRKRAVFTDPEAIAEFEQGLKALVASNAYSTEPSFSTNADLYPDQLIPFYNKHLDYLHAHPSTDPRHYLANLRLMTRKR